MQAIIGKVTEINASKRKLTVSAVVSAPGGGVKKRKFEVPWSPTTVFMTKGKKKFKSSGAKIKPGMTVIVQRAGPGKKADIVWHEPMTTAIALTERECKDLGGEIVVDSSCPNIASNPGADIRRRCKTAGGSSCITETRAE